VAPGVERQRDARAVRKDSARVDEGQIVGRLDAFVANLTGGEGVDRAFVGERRGRFSVAGDVAAGTFYSDGAGPGDGVGTADREIAIAPDIDAPPVSVIDPVPPSAPRSTVPVVAPCELDEEVPADIVP
jgi:hypothetical protein